MRARKKKWAPAELAGNPLIIRDDGDIRVHFGNEQPVYAEIGCGKGRFITESARRSPEINFLAIEREPAILAAAARRGVLLKSEVPCSLAFLLLDVSELGERIKPGLIDRLYINFCDPWPGKKKWAKRRLTHESFLKLYQRLVVPEIHFKTDNRFLFEFSLESFNQNGWKMQNISLNLHADALPDNIVTEYEEKFSKDGPIYRLEAINPDMHIL